jgi:hypothetical protein
VGGGGGAAEKENIDDLAEALEGGGGPAEEVKFDDMAEEKHIFCISILGSLPPPPP